MVILADATQFSQADSSALFFTILFLVICGALVIIINRTKDTKHRHWEQFGMVVSLCVLGLSLYNISVVDPNAKNTCIYNRYEKVYYKNNLKNHLHNRHFDMDHINDSQTNINAFDNAIPNTPRDAHQPVHSFWNNL